MSSEEPAARPACGVDGFVRVLEGEAARNFVQGIGERFVHFFQGGRKLSLIRDGRPVGPALLAALGPAVAAGGRQGGVFCLDAICYHAGGPLTEGDIEDAFGTGPRCVVCPWHKYRVSLSGEGLYLDLDRKVQTKGPRQRTHAVECRDDGIYVKLNTVGRVASDAYCLE